MKIVAITQARVGSSRLPAKVLKEIEGRSLLQIHLERVSQSKQIHQLVVATTTEPDAFKIEEVAGTCGVDVYNGSLDDVLDRYYQVAKKYNADYVVRITSDCPLLDAQLVDDVIQFALQQQVDYASNTLEATFPDGQDVEVVRFDALERAWQQATLASEREHVTAYIWKNSSHFGRSLFTSANFGSAVDYSAVRLTVDEQKDFDTIARLIAALGTTASWESYTKYYQDHLSHMSNNEIVRNAGYTKSLSTDI